MASQFKCNECGAWAVLRNGLCPTCYDGEECWACHRTFPLEQLRHDLRCAECDDADCDEQTCTHTPFDARFPGYVDESGDGYGDPRHNDPRNYRDEPPIGVRDANEF